MRRRTLVIAISLGLVSVLALGGIATAGGRDGDEGNGNGRRLSASLTGAAEFPGPGDADGSGSARLKVKPWKEQICSEIRVAAITFPALAAHIHQGTPGVAGPIVVTLPTPTAGASSGCVSVARSLAKAIKDHPGDYYVNVHNAEFPNGAVRGQLVRGFGGTTTTSRTFTTSLRGAAEVPGPGDPDGTGTASIVVTPTLNQVCWSISVAKITLPAIGAHIHQGAAGVAGPIVVALSNPDAHGVANGCVGGVSATLIAAILDHPSGYYVNVHTTDFPNGAVRGQLTGNGGDGDEDEDDDDGDNGDGEDDD
jgi:hypothetical protein